LLLQHGTNMLEPIWLRNGFVGAHLAWNNERVLDIDFIDETRREQFKMTLAGTDCGTRATQKQNQIEACSLECGVVKASLVQR